MRNLPLLALAGLLLFRLLYYIIPFALALAILGAREIIKGMFSNRVPQLGDIAADVFVPPPAGERIAASNESHTQKPPHADGSQR